MGRWSWAGDAWDFDHDGVVDLYVTNGFISGAEKKDLASFFWRQVVARSLDKGSNSIDYQLAWNAINELIRAGYSWNGHERNVFFLNHSDRTFSEISGPLGLDFIDDSRAFALADFDGDGRLEVILKNRTNPQLRILHNDLEPLGESVTIRLRGQKSNRDAIGAVVTIECGTLKQNKFIQAGSGFLSQHTKDLSFGLGARREPINATIQWPSGTIQRLENLPRQHLITVSENSVPQWKSKPFIQHRVTQTQANPTAHTQIVADFQSWLSDPVPAPDFSLPLPDGSTRTLKSFARQTFALGACERLLRCQ